MAVRSGSRAGRLADRLGVSDQRVNAVDDGVEVLLSETVNVERARDNVKGDVVGVQLGERVPDECDVLDASAEGEGANRGGGGGSGRGGSRSAHCELLWSG